MKILKILFFILAVCFLGYVISGRSARRYSQTQILMDTTVQVDICSEKPDRVMQMVYENMWKRMTVRIGLFDLYNAHSDVAKINSSFPSSVEVDTSVAAVIARSLKIYAKTGGAFDITVKPLSDLWKNAAQQGRAPVQKEIFELKQSLGPQTISLGADGRVALSNEIVRIDLGGIAKGFLVDDTARFLKSHGFNNFLINAGGDMFAQGRNCQEKNWQVGIRDPRSQGKLPAVLSISDRAVTTSGDYERFIEIEGKRFSHIIDPRSGFPVEKTMSATVIAPTAMDADAWATALSVLGEEGFSFLEEQGEDFAAMLIIRSQEGMTVKTTTHFNNFQSK